MLSCGMVEIPRAALGTPIIGGLTKLAGFFAPLGWRCPDPNWFSVAGLEFLTLLVILLPLRMRALVCPMIWLAAVVATAFLLRLSIILAQS